MSHTPASWASLPSDGTGPIAISDDRQESWFFYTGPGAATAPELSREEMLANARLIAAAPDLLAMLKRVSLNAATIQYATGEYLEISNVSLGEIERAIASAEGGAS